MIPTADSLIEKWGLNEAEQSTLRQLIAYTGDPEAASQFRGLLGSEAYVGNVREAYGEYASALIRAAQPATV